MRYMSMDSQLPKSATTKKQKKGVTTVEYAIMLVLIALAVALTTPNVSSAVVSVFGKTSSVLTK